LEEHNHSNEKPSAPVATA